MEYGLIGKKLSHSFSPVIHRAIGEAVGKKYDYRLVELEEAELKSFFGERDFKGVNVTVPYKKKAMKYLDVIDRKAKKIGSVNTVVNRDGRLYGYNTDADGMKDLLDSVPFCESLAFRTVAILGTGGTALTAAYVAKRKYPLSRTVFVSRDPKEKNEVGYEDVPENTALIINCTPVGMYPDNVGCPIDIKRFKKLVGVADAVYNPLRSRLVTEAQLEGIAAEGGMRMLVSQAVRSAELFLGKKIEHYDADGLQVGFDNVVFIGMPSCGKTYIGRKLAERTGKPFFDTDEMIEKSEGRPVRKIIEEDGEEYFRHLESKVIRELSERADGKIIATGGGAILDRENVITLKSNGFLIYVDKPLRELTATDDRPLSDTDEKLAAIYEERAPLYEKYADWVLEGDNDEMISELTEDYFPE